MNIGGHFKTFYNCMLVYKFITRIIVINIDQQWAQWNIHTAWLYHVLSLLCVKEKMTEIDKQLINKLDSLNWMTWNSIFCWWSGLTNRTKVLLANLPIQQWADFKKRLQKAFSTKVMSESLSQLYLIRAGKSVDSTENHFE